MYGGGGGDTYVVDHAGDQVFESGGQGIDSVYASVSWTLTAGSDVEVIIAEGLTSQNLTGNANGNVLRGNDASNILNGGNGNDDLTGFGGQDAFLFNTPLNAAGNIDRILDFNVADDTIRLEQAVFPAFGVGTISADQFVIGTSAQDASDRIIYNSSTGALFYDNDGIGGNAQVQFAELSRGLALTNLDFLAVNGTAQLPAPGGGGGGRLLVTGAPIVDLEADTTFSRTASIDYVDLNQSLVHQDYLVY